MRLATMTPEGWLLVCAVCSALAALWGAHIGAGLWAALVERVELALRRRRARQRPPTRTVVLLSGGRTRRRPRRW